MQVDHDATPQQPIDLKLAGGVLPHEVLQGTRFVRVEVIDVRIGEALELGGEQVHQPLEGSLFAREGESALGIGRPDGVPPSDDVHHTEEVFEAILEGVRIPLDVEEEVARRWDWQRGETTLWLDKWADLRKEELVLDLAFAPPFELNAGLLPDPLDGPFRRALEGWNERKRQGAELPQRRQAAIDQRAALLAADPRHQAQVIVAPTPGLAFDRPAADVAMLHGIRIGARRRVGRRRSVRTERLLEALLGGPVVRHEVVHAEADRLVGAPSERDVQPLWVNALQDGELVDVAADLEDRAGLDVPGQLGVGDLVMERAVRAWPIGRFAPQQKVGVPSPPAIEEGGLVDDLRARRHRLDGLVRRHPQRLDVVGCVGIAGDDHHRATICRQLGKVALLVLIAALPKHVELGIGQVRPCREAGEDRPLELGQVLTGKKAHEVRGGVDRLAVDELHATRSLALLRDRSPVARPELSRRPARCAGR